MAPGDSASETSELELRFRLALLECRRKLRASAEARRIMSLPNFSRLCRRRWGSIVPYHAPDAAALAELRTIYQRIQSSRKG